MGRPLFVLIDDDLKSASRIMDAVRQNESVEIRWLGDAGASRDSLNTLLAGLSGPLPSLMIVDLKSGIEDAASFVRSIAGRAAHYDIRIAAIAHSLDRDTRDLLLDAGASAVFERQHDPAAFDREIGSLVDFWRRSEKLSQAV